MKLPNMIKLYPLWQITNNLPMKHKLIFALFLLPLFVEAQNIAALPVEVKNKAAAKRIVFYLSGDGGMNTFSQKLVEELSAKNYALVSLDSRKYFWEQKSPEQLEQDLSALISHYLKSWDKDEFSIVGYSFGADAALLLAPRLSKDLQSKLKSLVLLSPSTSTDLVVKLTDMIGFGSKTAKYKTTSEIPKINSPMLFIFGADEESDAYKVIPDRKNIVKTLIPGSHKFNNDMKKVSTTVINGL